MVAVRSRHDERRVQTRDNLFALSPRNDSDQSQHTAVISLRTRPEHSMCARQRGDCSMSAINANEPRPAACAIKLPRAIARQFPTLDLALAVVRCAKSRAFREYVAATKKD